MFRTCEVSVNVTEEAHIPTKSRKWLVYKSPWLLLQRQVPVLIRGVFIETRSDSFVRMKKGTMKNKMVFKRDYVNNPFKVMPGGWTWPSPGRPLCSLYFKWNTETFVYCSDSHICFWCASCCFTWWRVVSVAAVLPRPVLGVVHPCFARLKPETDQSNAKYLFLFVWFGLTQCFQWSD